MATPFLNVRLPERVGDLRRTFCRPDLAGLLRRPEEGLRLVPLATWGSRPYAVSGALRSDAYMLLLAREEGGQAFVKLLFESLSLEPPASLNPLTAPALLTVPLVSFDVALVVQALLAHRRARGDTGPLHMGDEEE